jgi:hypothetical protein
VQMTGDFVTNRHAAARQSHHDEIFTAAVHVQVLREDSSCMTSIGEPCPHI